MEIGFEFDGQRVVPVWVYVCYGTGLGGSFLTCFHFSFSSFPRWIILPCFIHAYFHTESPKPSNIIYVLGRPRAAHASRGRHTTVPLEGSIN